MARAAVLRDEFPAFIRVRQRGMAPSLPDPAATVVREIQTILARDPVPSGASVAITAGSRGIDSLPVVLRAAAAELSRAGLRPFIVPAMGSHGGATSAGQLRVLRAMGITEKTIRAPIRSSMATVSLGQTDSGIPVYLDRHAMHADRILLVNRIAPHTEFMGPIQSGLMKMAAFGLGKRKGAEAYHDEVTRHSFQFVIEEIYRVLLERAPLWAGIGIVENQGHHVHSIEAVAAAAIPRRERELLRTAEQLSRALPFPDVHLLIVDTLGKDISGGGMDFGVVCRKHTVNGVAAPPGDGQVKRIAVRSLSRRTHGNATGLGIADFTHRRVVDAIDRKATYTNCLTANGPAGGAIPMYFDSDREMMHEAMRSSGYADPRVARIVWIRNTADLEECLVSESFRQEIGLRDDLETLEERVRVEFDQEGQIIAPRWKGQ